MVFQFICKYETQEWNDDLEMMDAYVLEGKKFVKLPEDEWGVFHSNDSYVYLCRYASPLDDPPPAEGGEGGGVDGDDAEEEFDQYVVVYFWQGRDSSNMGWLTFTFRYHHYNRLYICARNFLSKKDKCSPFL